MVTVPGRTTTQSKTIVLIFVSTDKKLEILAYSIVYMSQNPAERHFRLITLGEQISYDKKLWSRG